VTKCLTYLAYCTTYVLTGLHKIRTEEMGVSRTHS